MKAVLHLPVAEQYPSSTAMVDSFASKRTSGMSGGLLRSAQVLPIHVRAKVFAGHGAVCLALDVDCKAFAARLPVEGDVPNVSP